MHNTVSVGMIYNLSSCQDAYPSIDSSPPAINKLINVRIYNLSLWSISLLEADRDAGYNVTERLTGFSIHPTATIPSAPQSNGYDGSKRLTIFFLFTRRSIIRTTWPNDAGSSWRSSYRQPDDLTERRGVELTPFTAATAWPWTACPWTACGIEPHGLEPHVLDPQNIPYEWFTKNSLCVIIQEYYAYVACTD